MKRRVNFFDDDFKDLIEYTSFHLGIDVQYETETITDIENKCSTNRRTVVLRKAGYFRAGRTTTDYDKKWFPTKITEKEVTKRKYGLDEYITLYGIIKGNTKEERVSNVHKFRDSLHHYDSRFVVALGYLGLIESFDVPVTEEDGMIKFTLILRNNISLHNQMTDRIEAMILGVLRECYKEKFDKLDYEVSKCLKYFRGWCFDVECESHDKGKVGFCGKQPDNPLDMLGGFGYYYDGDDMDIAQVMNRLRFVSSCDKCNKEKGDRNEAFNYQAFSSAHLSRKV
jgi:hypothetical protein